MVVLLRAVAEGRAYRTESMYRYSTHVEGWIGTFTAQAVGLRRRGLIRLEWTAGQLQHPWLLTDAGHATLASLNPPDGAR